MVTERAVRRGEVLKCLAPFHFFISGKAVKQNLIDDQARIHALKLRWHLCGNGRVCRQRLGIRIFMSAFGVNADLGIIGATRFIDANMRLLDFFHFRLDRRVLFHGEKDSQLEADRRRFCRMRETEGTRPQSSARLKRLIRDIKS